jgi:hypothetical protein
MEMMNLVKPCDITMFFLQHRSQYSVLRNTCMYFIKNLSLENILSLLPKFLSRLDTSASESGEKERKD